MNTNKNIKSYTADVCVIGGGLAGMCAAIAAARHGSSVILVHDRPVLGGNCSSEIRMWPLGAHGKNRRETGIFEELVLNNLYRNPTRNYPIWDSVLYEAVKFQDNLTALLNCSIFDAEMNGKKISTVTGWQTTSYTFHRVTAKIFIDCSGDSILASLSGAEYRRGREAKSEFCEEAAPDSPDSFTMGNSCLIQARETPSPIKYIPPEWARKIGSDEQIKNRPHAPTDYRGNNFWWLELGGTEDTIADSEKIRDDLLALSFGTWDHIKNHGEHNAENWELDFLGFLPGKRESRRYVGDHILTQNEVQAGGKFKDIIAYGGWSIDNHPPLGFDHEGEPTTYYSCPSPFGIPYRCLYSVNIENLMFAGRNISVTHAAMAASRVMATCAVLGQAAGTAAHIAAAKKISPKMVGNYIRELQKILMDDDCWLPGLKREISESCKGADLYAECGNADNLRNGIDRPTDADGDNGCYIKKGSKITYSFKSPTYISSVRIIFDSDLNRETVTGGIPQVKDCPTICNRPLNMTPFTFPATMTRVFKLIADGEIIYETASNHQRLVRIDVNKSVKTVELQPTETYGSDKVHIFSFDF